MKPSSTYAESFALAAKSRGLRWFAAFCVLLFACSLSAFAQDATIVGTVTDPSGSVLPNVTVTVTNTDTGVARTLTSNDVGQYVAPALHIGHYSVQAVASGFATAVRSDIVLNAGDRARVDFAMKVGATQEHITVEANAVKVQSDTGEVSSVITGTQITQLGTNGRSLYRLITLVPGASSNESDFQLPTPMGGDQNVSFNGNRLAHNLFLLDGAEIADRGGSGAIVMPSLDAISEFRMMTSNYSAEYGLSSAATASSVLKSGTKTLHASAWWFGRNDYLNARPYFTKPTAKLPELRFNLWGFNVGGPVQFKHTDNPKTFFFYNMEWRRQIQGGNFNVGVPFTSTYGGNLNDAVNYNGGSLLQTAGVLPHVPDFTKLSTAEVNKFTALGLTSGEQFPSNTIDPSLLDPNAQALLAAGIFPAPTQGAQFVGTANAPTNVREEIVRVDHTFNDKFSIFGHWVQEKILQTDIPTRWSGANLPTVGDTFGNPSYSGVVHLTHIISPTLLNEIAFNYDGNRINMLPIGNYKLPSGFTQNRLFPTPTSVAPIIAINGKTGSNYNENWNPWINTADDYQIRDDISWTKGAHQLRIGGSWANFRKAQPLQVSTQGQFSFGGQFTGYDFADFLLGLASGYSEAALKDTRHWNSVSWAAYIQDNWRATNRLTLNLGLRWDGIPHTAEINGQMSNFLPSLYNPANVPSGGDVANNGFANSAGTQICSGNGVPNASCTAASAALAGGPNPALAGLLFYANGLGVPGKTPGVTNGLVNNHWATFAPRIGFAYDLTGSGKTIVRGGFGSMFERIQGNDMYQAGGNNLFGGNASISNVSLGDPHIAVDQTNAVISTAALPVTVNSLTELDPNRYKIPTSYQYSIGVQQALGATSVLSITYVGNQNRFQSYAQESNLPPVSSLVSIAQNRGAGYNFLLPYLGYHSVKVDQTGQNSHYNSMQIELRSNLRQGLQLQAAYTLARAIDPSTGTGGDGFDLDTTTNPFAGWKYDVGPAVFDRTHVAFVNFVYDLPIFKNSGNRFEKGFLGGWQVAAVITMESGIPLNLGVSGGNGNICSWVPNCAVRPDKVGAISYPKTAATLSSNGIPTIQWYNPAAFAGNVLYSTPTTTVWGFGNFQHNGLYGPGRDNWDLSMYKTFAPTERLHIELRAESYNTWNHTQFRGVDTGIGGTDAGKANSAWDPRVFQLGAKVSF